jgi:ASC-1-like (ASCH) protein
MKRTDNYASNQIRILLHELKNPSHKIKVKAIETFRSYIETYHQIPIESYSSQKSSFKNFALQITYFLQK